MRHGNKGNEREAGGKHDPRAQKSRVGVQPYDDGNHQGSSRRVSGKLQNDPFYRLTANVEEASEKESAEILSELDELTDDDLTISSKKSFEA